MIDKNKIMYSVIIPVFNSDSSLPILCKKLKAVFEKKIQANFEIIFIDDKSTNVKTWNTLQELKNNFSFVKIYQLRKNSGQHFATFCGLKQAKGDFVITMDDDLQHDPDETPKLIEKMQANKDCGVSLIK